MECRDTERLIDDYLDGQLGAETAERVESHLATCSRCRRKYAPLLQLLRSPEPVTIPEGLRERVLATVTRQTSRAGRSAGIGRPLRRARFTWAPWTGAVAASLAIFLLGWLSSQWWTKPVQPTPQLSQPPKQIVFISPWLLSGWAQAAALPGPTNPMLFVAQAAATERLIQPAFDTAPAVHIRPHAIDVNQGTPEGDLSPVEILFFAGLYRL